MLHEDIERSGRNGPLTGRYGKMREEWTTDGEIWRKIREEWATDREIWKDQGGMDH